MKSYFLIGTAGRPQTQAVMDELLPAQRDPWVLFHATNGAVAYLSVEPNGDVQADVSGRHYNQDDAVLEMLEVLKVRVGGKIENDD